MATAEMEEAAKADAVSALVVEALTLQNRIHQIQLVFRGVPTDVRAPYERALAKEQARLDELAAELAKHTVDLAGMSNE